MSLSCMIKTERLSLRPFEAADAADFVVLAGDLAVARMTSDIPHPLDPGEAIRWVSPGEGELRLAVEHGGRLIGGVGYYIREEGVGELGFWLGRAFWGHGFATEAARAVVAIAFEQDGLASLSSCRFEDNAASGRVLEKLGFAEVGSGLVWCEARGHGVRSAVYWLDHRRSGGGRRKQRGDWSDRIARLLGRTR